MLRETAGAPETLARQRAVAEVAALRDRRREVARDLDERLAPQSRTRAALALAIADDERDLDTLRAELAGYERASAVATGEARRADADAADATRRAETARALGADGICAVCGQTYGASLEHALAHFAGESVAARDAATAARARSRAAQDRRAEVSERIAACMAAYDARRTRLEDAAAIPGEEARARATLRELDAALEATPEELRVASDTPEQAVATEALVARRNVAEAALARHEPLAAELGAASAAEGELLHALADLDRRLHELRAAIGRDEPAAATVHAAEEALTAASGEQDEAVSAAAAARAAADTWATHEAVARAAHDRATEVATRVATSFRTLLVAERTEEVLRRVLVEIAAEARPRLIDMLDGWMRALLGPRFRRIDLTDDYRIRADSGSGWREIDHFSGGEQTVLAIMLRVSIALFCQERAGFERGFLILDEVFGDQDGEHRAQLVQFLGEIKEHFHQVLVVNHVEDVTELLDNVIDVRPVSLAVSAAAVRP